MSNQFHTPSFGDDVYDLFGHEEDNADAAVGEHNKVPHQLLPDPHKQNYMNPMPEDDFDISLMEATTSGLGAENSAPDSGDPNEPAKPISAYALFFRDSATVIKKQTKNCSFQELSRIVAAMWEALDPIHKASYMRKSEIARLEYKKYMIDLAAAQQPKMPADNTFVGPGSLQSKPAVFTIPRTTPASESIGSSIYSNQTLIPHQQTVVQSINPPNSNQQQQQLVEMMPPPPPPPPPFANQQYRHQISMDYQLQQHTAALHQATTSMHQLQMLTEAGSAAKCTRDGCNKLAIITPDWEDEYCSNECVVSHCRSVFSSWVQSNLSSEKE